MEVLQFKCFSPSGLYLLIVKGGSPRCLDRERDSIQANVLSLSQLQTNHTSLQAKYSDMKKTLTEVSICPLLPYCDLRAHSLSPRSDHSGVDTMKLPSPAVDQTLRLASCHTADESSVPLAALDRHDHAGLSQDADLICISTKPALPGRLM